MYEATVNGGTPFQVANEGNLFFLNGQQQDIDIHRIDAHSFQVIHAGESYKVHILRVDAEAKTVVLKVNGKRAEVQLTSEMDRVLKRLGFGIAGSGKATNLKAPMPGLIHTIMVQPGQTVAKGEPLLILEAMKMENVIKAAADGRVDQVHVAKGANVDKGALLISFA